MSTQLPQAARDGGAAKARACRQPAPPAECEATRAAKKQNVGFKIACTGTPVENTLADLWCLFDFVQPGLLGALNDFGQRYCKPIEAKDDEERARVEELRVRISPQILRRTKVEVAKDLPQKIVVDAFYRRKHQNIQFKKVGVINQFFNAQAREQAGLNDFGMRLAVAS